jgi:hypothetical protein
MKSYQEQLEDFTKEVSAFITQKVLNILPDKERYIKFDTELAIAEGKVLGLTSKGDGKIQIVLLDEVVDEIAMIEMDFLAITELTDIADMLQTGISLDLIDNL